ncbi:Calcineurin-like phosphoesterase superfamily protein [Oribacterium sp. KHPX15]|uniref:metallophosphoesterase n=1 Tax=Oribacterium sp. KHPX15 TaxID=1855342 RepID=UPI0008949343|nr:metallophosphoesterase [Oribacterium sp. KHPX15]SEA28397.1 Calcineurin-like phosphoesterase superfamily protein [Oribacterium sp. KHPX15]
MIYFTADMHFGHRAIITMQNRPFESVEEMDKVLLQNYNAVVQKDDTVYILGDICHHMKIEDADNLIKKLNGKKYLIRGNHDKNYDPRLFADIQDFMKISVDGKAFSLMHYPMLSWPKKGSGGYHLHGHIHARMEYNETNRSDGQRRYDVGVDANNFFPVSAKQIVSFFEEHSTDEFSISRNTLNVMDAAISNLNEGKVSERIEI